MEIDDRQLHSVFPILRQASVLYSGKEAVSDGYRRLTYDQLYHETEALSSGLLQKGVHAGDKVIVCLPNWSEFVSIFFALAKIGAILVPCNPGCQQKEWNDIFLHTKIKAIFCMQNDQNLHYFNNKKEEEMLSQIISVRFRYKNLPSFDDLVDMGESHTDIEQKLPYIGDISERLNVILFTSGSTGTPKGVMLTQNNLLFGANNIRKYLQCDQEDVFFVPVPVYHVFGLIPGILTPILSGGRIVFTEKFHAKQALATIEEEKVTVHYGVPTMFILEMNHADFKKTNFACLRTGLMAGSPCSEDLVKKIRSEMKCNIIVSYGATETSAGVTFTSFYDDDFHRANTVGKAVAGASIKIVNEERQILSEDTVGELACKGLGIMKGYFQMPESPALDNDGWFYTGDLAKIDTENYLYIVGRKKDMIIRGGYNIYPWELESVYHTHPDIEDVSVIGLPDTVLGEVICAVIKLKPNHGSLAADTEAMKNFLKDKVADCKVPDHIFFIDHFPLNGAGKIDKHTLRQNCEKALKTVLR